MALAADFHLIASQLEGTTTAPHFGRTAFKVARIYATLDADNASANIRLSPEEQEFKCLAAPEIFCAIPNAWGRQGWTRVELATISLPELEAILRQAWALALPKPKRKKFASGASRPA